MVHSRELFQGAAERQGKWVDRAANAAAHSPQFAKPTIALAAEGEPQHTGARYGLRAVRLGEARVPGPPQHTLAAAPVFTEHGNDLGVIRRTTWRVGGMVAATSAWVPGVASASGRPRSQCGALCESAANCARAA